MGTWGTAILSDDTARDVYASYMERYNDGLAHEIIREQLLVKFAEVLEDQDDSPVFWLAFAKSQWECGVLQSDVYQRVLAIIESGINLSRWKEEGEKALHKREQVLHGFLQCIRMPKEKPRKRRKVNKCPAIYTPGDCLAIHLPDGDYGAAIVLAADNSHQTEGMNLVGLLAYKQPRKPPIDIFEPHGTLLRQRNWLKLTHHNWNEKIVLYWCPARLHKNAKSLF